MFVIYDEIRLDPSVKMFEVNDSDWAINPKAHTMQHNPTKTVFDIELDEQKTESEPITVLDFSSRLVAIDRGCVLPPCDVIETLGRTAIVLYLLALGYMQPQETSEDTIPENMLRSAHAC